MKKKPLSKKIQELKEGTLSSGQISEQLKTFISTCKDEGIKYSDLSKIEEEYLKELKSQLLFKIIEETKSENPNLAQLINKANLTELQDKISKTVTLEEADQDKLNQILYEMLYHTKPGNELATFFKTALISVSPDEKGRFTESIEHSQNQLLAFGEKEDAAIVIQRNIRNMLAKAKAKTQKLREKKTIIEKNSRIKRGNTILWSNFRTIKNIHFNM